MDCCEAKVNLVADKPVLVIFDECQKFDLHMMKALKGLSHGRVVISGELSDVKVNFDNLALAFGLSAEKFKEFGLKADTMLRSVSSDKHLQNRLRDRQQWAHTRNQHNPRKK